MKRFGSKSFAYSNLGGEGIAPHNRVPLLFVCWVVTSLLVAVPSLVGQHKPSEYQVEAAYLYNFGRFVDWPTNSAGNKGNSFTVCVLGEDPFGSTLDATLEGETIAGRRVVAKRISVPQESDNCQILFLSAAEAGNLNKVMEGFDKRAVLTVSDIPHFSERGGMIQFVREGDRVRFEVNLAAAQRAGLTISSELLKVATVVRRNPAGGD
jgi:YfiR/HmsC-like